MDTLGVTSCCNPTHPHMALFVPLLPEIRKCLGFLKYSDHRHPHNNHLSSIAAGPDFLPFSGSITSWISGCLSLRSSCLDLEGSLCSAFEEILNSILYFKKKCFFSLLFPRILKLTRKTRLNWPQYILESLCDFWPLAFPSSLQ